MTLRTRPLGITALSLFFVFGSVMSGLAAMMLLFPASFLDPLWRLNPHAHDGFAAMGPWAVVLMLVVCAACVTAAVGLWNCTRWGFLSAVAILSINLLGDLANVFLSHDWHTLIGLPIGALMIFYLLQKRGVFARVPAKAD